MKTNSNAPKTIYLGLDVHKAETVIAILESDRDAEPRHYGSVATTQHALERAMRRIAKNQKCALSDLHVCYEASGCGFWIARRFLQMGIRCDVIAPSLIPTKSGDRVKTDKRDAAKLAKNLRSNDLVAVNIPDSVDEAIRDLCRARTDAVDDLRRAKTRLLALLRRLGYNYDGPTGPKPTNATSATLLFQTPPIIASSKTTSPPSIFTSNGSPASKKRCFSC
jgi:transposase